MGGRPSWCASLFARVLPAAVCLLLCGAGVYSSPTASAVAAAQPAASPDPGFLNQWRQGKDPGELARTWYRTPQGSYLLDYDVFMSIPAASSQRPFSARENLESYGFLYLDRYVQGVTDDDGLPIGVVKDTQGEGHKPLEKHAQALTRDYVGLTCAACHTGDLNYNGRRFLIHAGQSNIDYERFISNLYAAVSKTVQDPNGTGYVARMAARGADEKTAATRLAAAQQRMDGLRSRGQVPDGREAGPGRIDAVGHILNEVFAQQYADPNSNKPIQVPVSVPAVWNAARLQCVQTNCLTSNSLTRNVGEVLGVFGDSETYKDSSGGGGSVRPPRSRTSTHSKKRSTGSRAPGGRRSSHRPRETWPRAPRRSPPTANAATHSRISTSSARSGTASGENWSGKNAPSDLDRTLPRRGATLGRPDTCGRSPELDYENVGHRRSVHQGARRLPVHAERARDRAFSTARCATGSWRPSARRSAALAPCWRPGSRSWRAATRHVTGQAIVDTGIREAEGRSAHRDEPVAQAGRVGDDADSPGGVDRERRGLVFPRLVPASGGRRKRARQIRVLPGPAAADDPGPDGRCTALARSMGSRSPPLMGTTAPGRRSSRVLFPETRPESFWVGHGEFDPNAVGVDIKKGEVICGGANRLPTCFKVTTTEHQPGTDDSGNSRSGHAGARFFGGREPTPEEKRAIIEYLKSI